MRTAINLAKALKAKDFNAIPLPEAGEKQYLVWTFFKRPGMAIAVCYSHDSMDGRYQIARNTAKRVGNAEEPELARNLRKQILDMSIAKQLIELPVYGDAWAFTWRAVGDDTTRPVLMCVQICCDGQEVRVAATDSYQLHVWRKKVEDCKPFEFLIPAHIAKLLADLRRESPIIVRIGQFEASEEAKAVFAKRYEDELIGIKEYNDAQFLCLAVATWAGEIAIITPTPAGKYPRFDHILEPARNREYIATLAFRRQKLIQALKDIKPYAQKSAGRVVFDPYKIDHRDYTQYGCRLISGDYECPVLTHVELSGIEGYPRVFAVNRERLLAAAESMADSHAGGFLVKLSAEAHLDPLYIVPEEESPDGSVHEILLMPMTVENGELSHSPYRWKEEAIRVLLGPFAQITLRRYLGDMPLTETVTETLMVIAACTKETSIGKEVKIYCADWGFSHRYGFATQCYLKHHRRTVTFTLPLTDELKEKLQPVLERSDENVE
ncbi:MAG: hypothetical protein JRD89_00360 [Deltaproteobacteria bacterium]|nr:hypothetical protein [Deltaproteobacteria bacterium]